MSINDKEFMTVTDKVFHMTTFDRKTMELTKSLSIIKALGDESRLMIIDSLKEKPMYVEELAERMNLAVSTVSFHLKKLEAAGIVRVVKEQYYSVYHLNENLLGLSLNNLTSFTNHKRIQQDKRMVEYRGRVISAFFNRKKLLRMPAQYKKRIIILEEILKKFNSGTAYAEKELDEIISTTYSDYCSVRRSFIDEKMMMRKDGIYSLNDEYVHQFPSAATKKNSKNGNGSVMDKTELKKEYKLKGTPMGVYTIFNPDSGNLFIGSARNVNAIINRHKFELSTRIHKIEELQDSWNNYKDAKLKFEVIDILKPKDEPGYDYKEDLKELEDLWIEKLQEEGRKSILMKNTGVK
jgi:DNA-binding HxlR family transcriptional regulator